MILKALHIANFKAFAASQRVPLRPITLIYGANSAGKSSILHALALTHHAIETGNLDTQRTQIGGEAIDLGGFLQYVHRRERQRQVELGFELDPKRFSGRVAELFRSAREIVVELAIGEGITSEQQDLFGYRVRDLARESGCRVERFAVEVDGASLLSMSARAGGLLRLDRLDHNHPVFRKVLRRFLIPAMATHDVRDEDFRFLGDVLDVLVPGIIARSRGLFPRVEEESEGSEAEGEGWDAFMSVSRGRRKNDILRAAQNFVPKVLRELVGGLGATIEDEIRRLRYLGPLRSYPPRHLAFSQNHDPDWFASGGYAWDLVRRHGEVRRRVNSWLGDPERFQTTYELMVRDLLPSSLVAAELPSRLTKEFHDLLASIISSFTEGEQPDFSLLAEELVARLEYARNVGGRDHPNIDLGDLGPFPEIEELVASVTDADAISQRWTEKVVASRTEVLRDLVLCRPAHRHPRKPPRRRHRSESGAPGAGLRLCVNGQVPGDRATRNPSASGTPGRARRCLHRIGPRGRSKHLPDRDPQRAPDSTDHAPYARDKRRKASRRCSRGAAGGRHGAVRRA